MPGVWKIYEQGGPEKLVWETEPKGRVGARHVLVRHTAIGLNYLDIYQRSGTYPVELPAKLGVEAAGIVEKVGDAVTEFEEGDRVAYAGIGGAYAEYNRVLASRLVPIPDAISDEIAAASLLKGLTAAYLMLRTFEIKDGDTALIHAGAGGVGLILTQWAKYLGVRVVSTVSTIAKTRLAYDAGAEHVVVYGQEDLLANVMKFTDKKGVHAVYDSVGADTFRDSIDCLRKRGTLICYGNSSGLVPPVDLQMLMAKGSLYITRPSLVDYIADPEELKELSSELFSLIEMERLTISINQRYPLSDLPQAHKDIEARKTTGSTVLLP